MLMESFVRNKRRIKLRAIQTSAAARAIMKITKTWPRDLSGMQNLLNATKLMLAEFKISSSEIQHD